MQYNQCQFSRIKLQLQKQTITQMSLLSAGKQIIGDAKSYGRGLFIVDPVQVEKKARKLQDYQQQLRMQMEEDRRRKKDRKRMDKQDDQRLERKINEDNKKQDERKVKVNNNNRKNDKNIQSCSKAQKPKQQQLRYQKTQQNELSPQSPIAYNFDYQHQPPYDQHQPLQSHQYNMGNINIYNQNEEQYFHDSQTQQMKMFRQNLYQKTNEIYKKLKQSQEALEIDKEIQFLRKKIASTNHNYQEMNESPSMIGDEYSHFYKLPKKLNSLEGHRQKNLNYESVSKIKIRKYMDINQSTHHFRQSQMQSNRNIASRGTQISNQDKQWGRKKGKDHLLGNRESLDSQIVQILRDL